MKERFPGYNVVDKRNTLSWNEPTRRAIDKRLSVHPVPRYFTQEEWKTLSRSAIASFRSPRLAPRFRFKLTLTKKCSLA